MLADGRSPHSIKWIKELKKHFDIYVISFNGFNDEIKLLVKKNNLYDCSIVIKTDGNNFIALKQLPKVIKIIKMIEPKYINAHYITSYGTIATLANLLVRAKAKIILSTWGSDILVTPARNCFYRLITKIILKYADLITSDSKFMTGKIKDIYSKTRILTFPFGIEKMPNVDFAQKNKDKFFSNRALEPNYNIDLIIKEFYKLWLANNARQLIIAHDGSEKLKLIRLAEKLGIKENIKFVGFLTSEEQEKMYSECQYYFSLPTSDSTSVSLLEAMSCGCIPIVSNIPANKEWIENGINGYIYKINEKINIKNIEDAFSINRRIISERAIWSNNILLYIKELEQI